MEGRDRDVQMSSENQDRIDWLFARTIAFILAFMVVAIVGGFVGARLLGLPVDLKMFYTIIGQAFFLVLGVVVGRLSSNTKA